MIGLTRSDAFQGASELCDQAVLLYCAGANERSNEEMRRPRKSYLIYSGRHLTDSTAYNTGYKPAPEKQSDTDNCVKKSRSRRFKLFGVSSRADKEKADIYDSQDGKNRPDLKYYVKNHINERRQVVDFVAEGVIQSDGGIVIVITTIVIARFTMTN